MKSEASGARIGELAATLGINPKTIRYYEEIGLLQAPRRTSSGYRMYGAADIDRLRFIGKAKAIGLSLDEIRGILTLRGEGKRPCRHVVGLIDRKVEVVDRQLRALEDFRQELVGLRDEAARTVAEDGDICTIIEHHQPSHASPPALVPLAGPLRRPSRG